MLPKRFDQTRPFFVLGLLLFAWIFVGFGVKVATRATFFEIQAPLVVADSYVQDLQDFWANRLLTKDELRQAGREVAGLIAQYAVAVQQNKTLEAERLRLENLLNLPSMPAYRFEAARVARRDFTGWWQHMVIRKGSNYGITVGAPVVFAGGVVGRISAVHRYTSEVDMVTSPTFRVAASIEGDTRPISYTGGLNEAFSAPRGIVEYVPLEYYANRTSTLRLVTSSLGGVFPPGLTVGDINHLEPGPDGLFKNGEVALDPRLGSLTEVTVLVPLNPDEN